MTQGDDDFEEVPGSDMVVSRTAHRDNKSDYFVDGRKSTFTAVTELLKGKGIDLDNNRFLILQVRKRIRRRCSVMLDLPLILADLYLFRVCTYLTVTRCPSGKQHNCPKNPSFLGVHIL